MSLIREGAVRVAMILGVVALGLGYEEWQKPRIGGSCSAGTGSCLDADTDLSCQDGKYAPVACHGPLGCAKADGKIRCDVSGNAPGDKCTKSFEGTGSCSTDGKALLTCTGGEFTSQSCLGPKGCEKNAERKSACDNSRDVVGGACKDGHVCSLDGAETLECVAGHFAAERHCGGPKGCWSDAEKFVHCDTTIATVGELCRAPSGGCSADGKEMLKCTDAGAFASVRLCRGGGCGLLAASDGDGGASSGCADLTVAEPGDFCAGDYGACSVDHKKLLRCVGGTFTMTHSCTCAMVDGAPNCVR